MKIERIDIMNDGWVSCKSSFYSAHDVLDDKKFTFSTGLNTLIGDIDSGNWAISYLLSMYPYDHKTSTLFHPLTAVVNNQPLPLEQLWKYTCYLDKKYPLFSARKSVRRQVAEGLKKNRIEKSAEEIRDLFHMDKNRFERPVTGVGNEIYRALAAIGYCNKKQVFCFPWLSRKRFDGYHLHMPDLFEILESLEAIIILPVGKE